MLASPSAFGTRRRAPRLFLLTTRQHYVTNLKIFHPFLLDNTSLLLRCHGLIEPLTCRLLVTYRGSIFDKIFCEQKRVFLGVISVAQKGVNQKSSTLSASFHSHHSRPIIHPVLMRILWHLRLPLENWHCLRWDLAAILLVVVHRNKPLLYRMWCLRLPPRLRRSFVYERGFFAGSFPASPRVDFLDSQRFWDSSYGKMACRNHRPLSGWTNRFPPQVSATSKSKYSTH